MKTGRTVASVLLAGASAIAAGCTTDGEGRAWAGSEPDVCRNPGGSMQEPRLTASAQAARQGAEVVVGAVVYWPPSGDHALPANCLSDWRIAPSGAARLSPDGARLIVAEDAPAGRMLEVSVRVRGGWNRRISLSLPVVGADEPVLAGRWNQQDVVCLDGARPIETVRELDFRLDGQFNVTYRPFESYVDYWGRYEWDRETGRLTMDVTGGNAPPAARRLEGALTLDGDRLVLDGLSLGDGQRMSGHENCRYVFARS